MVRREHPHRLRCQLLLCYPKQVQSFVYGPNIIGSAKYFNAVQMWNVTFLSNNVARKPESLAKIGITRANDATQVCSIARIVKEPDDLLRNSTVAVSTPVRGNHKNIRLVCPKRCVVWIKRNTSSRQAKFLHKASCVLRNACEVDQLCHGTFEGVWGGLSMPSRCGSTVLCYASRAASSAILSGRKPDQWPSSVMTTGACRYPSSFTWARAPSSSLRSKISYSMPLLSSARYVALHCTHDGFV